MSDLMRGVKAILDNKEDYQEALDYYTGDVQEHFANARMRRLLQNTGEAYRINLAKTPVDVVADRLTISAITVPQSDDLTNALQERVWDANNLLMAAPAIMRKTLAFGDGYVMVWPTAEEGGVNIVFNSPLTTRVMYDQENEQTEEYAIKLWHEDGPEFGQWRATLYYPDRIERYVTVVNGSPDQEDDWRPLADEDGMWPMRNPYGRIPVFHFRTAAPYGTPEHKAAYGPQNAVNKLIVTQMATTDYHGFPQRYALSEGVKGLSNPAQDDWDDDDDVEANDPTQGLEAGPGGIWFLDGVKGTGQYDAADPENFLKPLAIYVRLLAQVTNTPLHYFDPSGDAPSGESLRTAEAPLRQKVLDRQMAFASPWSNTFSFALQVIGAPANTKVDVRWASPVSVTDSEGWNTLTEKRRNGVPLRQILNEAGYTAEQMDAWGIPQVDEPQPPVDPRSSSTRNNS